jgi:hypothetical protein
MTSRASFSVCSLIFAMGCGGTTAVLHPPGTAGATGTNGAAGDPVGGTAGSMPQLNPGAPAAGGAGGDDLSGTAGAPVSGTAGATGGGTAGAQPDAGAPSGSADASTGVGFVGVMSQAMPVGDQTLPRKLYILNSCSYDIWTFGLPNGTLKIAAGDLQVIGWSNKFSGRVWPRSGCTGTGNNPKCAQTATTRSPSSRSTRA